MSAADVDVCSFWWYKAYVNIRRGSLVRWCQSNNCAVVENASLSIAISSVWSSHWLYILHGFARFSSDSMALCIIYNLCCAILRYCCKSHRCGLWSVAYLGFQKGGPSPPIFPFPSPPFPSHPLPAFPPPFPFPSPPFLSPLPSLSLPLEVGPLQSS